MMIKIIITLIFLSVICGRNAEVPKLDNRIVGGKNASMVDYPYQVSVRKHGSHMCGGSVFHTSYILTAAHCVFDGTASYFSVRAGSRFINKGGAIGSVCSIIVKENYNPDTLNNDISILKLCNPLKFSERILPIALPEVGEEVVAGTRAVVSGWGYEAESGGVSSVLKQVDIPIVSQTECKKAYSKDADVTNNMICAGVTKVGGKDACQGDSGGPLRANGKLMGVISWGFGCARPQYPGVYTKVSNYRDWIRKITNY